MLTVNSLRFGSFSGFSKYLKYEPRGLNEHETSSAISVSRAGDHVTNGSLDRKRSCWATKQSDRSTSTDWFDGDDYGFRHFRRGRGGGLQFFMSEIRLHYMALYEDVFLPLSELQVNRVGQRGFDKYRLSVHTPKTNFLWKEAVLHMKKDSEPLRQALPNDVYELERKVELHNQKVSEAQRKKSVAGLNESIIDIEDDAKLIRLYSMGIANSIKHRAYNIRASCCPTFYSLIRELWRT